MANRGEIMGDRKVSAQAGRATGPVAQKPQPIKVKTVSPGFVANKKIPKRGGGQ